ncbi:MAG: sigma-70 family RNA polymerase sigma factor [Planctomycetota bacterium]|nr:MAG: sigma-70 family RNA polymerase sigma factor [Planctomycetota bacterium]
MSTDARAAEALAFARRRLGPASERWLSRPAALAAALSRLEAGAALEDAVLGVVHRAAAQDRGIADEFIAFFLLDLYRMAQATLSPALQRYLDQGDLVDSVLGDLWPRLAELQFETRQQFLAFLAHRLRWKASDRARQLDAGRRREDLRVEADPAALPAPVRDSTPSSLLRELEDRDRLILFLARLGEDDRRLLRLHLQGLPAAEIARQTGIPAHGVRRRIRNAVRSFQSLSQAPE